MAKTMNSRKRVHVSQRGCGRVRTRRWAGHALSWLAEWRPGILGGKQLPAPWHQGHRFPGRSAGGGVCDGWSAPTCCQRHHAVHKAADSRVLRLFLNADWYSTFCFLANVPAADDSAAVAAGSVPPIDSLNMWPLLSGSNASSPRDWVAISSSTVIVVVVISS